MHVFEREVNGHRYRIAAQSVWDPDRGRSVARQVVLGPAAPPPVADLRATRTVGTRGVGDVGALIWVASNWIWLRTSTGHAEGLARRAAHRWASWLWPWRSTDVLAFDTTNFDTHIATVTPGELARRGHAKSKRSDLRVVGLGLLVSETGHVPLLYRTYSGNGSDQGCWGRAWMG